MATGIFVTIDDMTLLKDPLDGTEYFAGRDDTGDFKILVSDFLKGILANSYKRNYVIDGDFNFWSNGTSFSADGYTADMWYWDFGSVGVGTVTRQNTVDANIEKYFVRINITTGSTNQSLTTSLKDMSLVINKSISCFARIKSSTGMTALNFRSGRFNGAATLWSASSALPIASDDEWAWYRWDIDMQGTTVTSPGAQAQFQLYNNTSELFTLDVDKIRVVDRPDNLPDDIIPDWIKADENPLFTRRLKDQYYIKLAPNNTTPRSAPLSFGHGIDADNARFVIPVANNMRATPTVTVNGVLADRELWNNTAGGLTNITNTVSGEYQTSRYVSYKVNDTAKFAANNGYFFGTDSNGSIEIDAR